MLLVGSTLSGKTTFLRALCHGDAPRARRSIYRTVGCHTDVSEHVAHDGAKYHVEWLEVAAASQYRESRGILLRECQGILAVFDAGSERSYAAVAEWLAEIAAQLAIAAGQREASSTLHGARPWGSGLDHRVAEEEDAGPPSTRRRLGGDSYSATTATRQAGHDGASRVSHTAAVAQSRVQRMAACLRDLPILLIANKVDTLTTAERSGGSKGVRASGWRLALSSGASRTKLEVRLQDPDAGSVTMCGITCRRPRTQRVTLDVPVATAVSYGATRRFIVVYCRVSITTHRAVISANEWSTHPCCRQPLKASSQPKLSRSC